MVGAEDTCAAVVGMFVEPVHSRCNNDAAAISHKDVIEYQPWQRVVGVTPRGDRGWNAEGKFRSLEELPGGFVSSPTEIEVCTQNRGVVLYLAEQVPRLLCPTRSPEPAVSRGSTGIQMRADEA
jgi:hypothetical protein